MRENITTCPMCGQHELITRTKPATAVINDKAVKYDEEYCYCFILAANGDSDCNFTTGYAMNRNMHAVRIAYNKPRAKYKYTLCCMVNCEIPYDKYCLNGMTTSQIEKILNTAFEQAPACDFVDIHGEPDIENHRFKARGLFVYQVNAVDDVEAYECANYAFKIADTGIFTNIARGDYYIKEKIELTVSRKES